MMGTALQFNRVHEDGFYTPVKARRNQNNRSQQSLRKQEQERRVESTQFDAIETQNESGETKVESSSEKLVAPCSNLHRFLESTTPSVPAQYFSKTTMRRGWRTCDVEYQHYFTLGDLWEFFKEWSAYGVGVPLVMGDGKDCVVQYYVPYLSGIQLYGQMKQASAILRQSGEDSDTDYCRDSSSDGSSDYDSPREVKHTVEEKAPYRLPRELLTKIGRITISEKTAANQDESSSDDSDTGSSTGCLLFEFLEQDLPYSREPLEDKASISVLSRLYPGLKTLRSCDLLPASWLSVAWYPIYRIPTGSTLRDLDACFLTYHSLSTPLIGLVGFTSSFSASTVDAGSGHAPVELCPIEVDGIVKFTLHVFGMATYKFKGSMWAQNGSDEQKQANTLMQAADSWLRLLKVDHPDFQFFASHGTYYR
ncbi:Protein of unknown function DUF789 [Dillenia turbinata]|uniref:Uncharacterized protein n=1 Tax=Dillenia turbinata TaxID=194707 RepID=A0AAN8V035_9MAGN